MHISYSCGLSHLKKKKIHLGVCLPLKPQYTYILTLKLGINRITTNCQDRRKVQMSVENIIKYKSHVYIHTNTNVTFYLK